MDDASIDKIHDEMLDDVQSSFSKSGQEHGPSDASEWDKLTKNELVQTLSYHTINAFFPEDRDGEIVGYCWYALGDKMVAHLQDVIKHNGDLQQQCAKHEGLEHMVISFMLDRLRDMRIYCEANLSSDSEGSEEGTDSNSEGSEEGTDSEEEVSDESVDGTQVEVSGESVDDMQVEINSDVHAVPAAEAAYDSGRPAVNNASTTSKVLKT